MLDFKDISVQFGSQYAVQHVSLRLHEGELLTLLGPSGCGKSTLIRVAAGFLSPDQGQLWIAGCNMTSWAPEQRPTATVFQSHALFPHLSVEDNVAYGLKARGIPQQERRKHAGHMLERVGLEGYGQRQVQALSGGQQQRVALARALILNPKVLLLDEPLSSLDAGLRVQMRQEIRRLQQAFGLTALYVTHDQEEALSISDRVAVMRAGHIEQLDTPETIFSEPNNAFTATFVSNANCLESPDHTVFFVRPGTIGLSAPGQSRHGVPGRIRERQFKGAVTTYLVDIEDLALPIENQIVRKGQMIRIDVPDPDSLCLAPGALVDVCLPKNLSD